MSRPKTTKIIPTDVRGFLLASFEKGYKPDGRGKRKKYIEFTKKLNAFLKAKTNEAAFADIADNFDEDGVSEDTIFRAVGYKKRDVCEGSEPTRNLLAYFATEGLRDWNSVIRQQFPQYLDLIDIVDKSSTSTRSSDSPTKQDQILAIVKTIHSRFDPGEQETKLIVGQFPNKRGGSSQPDPNNPEFPPPPYTPRFPASDSYQIEVPGFKNVWLKDESTNPTGTHKDRMAYEIAVQVARQESSSGEVHDLSLISSGSAAIAIQFFFNLYGVKAKLRVLVNVHLEEHIKESIREIGCLLFEEDLSKIEMNSKAIKAATKNKNGADLTYREVTDIDGTKYYDWLSFEILNINPTFCFIPFGSGDLFTNVMRIVKNSYIERHYNPDPRLMVDINGLTRCHFLASSTTNPESKLQKLFSYHLPSLKDHKGYLNKLKKNKLVGNLSSINYVTEENVDEAIAIANGQNINCEPSAIAGLALLLQMRNYVNPRSKILIVSTGSTIYRPALPNN